MDFFSVFSKKEAAAPLKTIVFGQFNIKIEYKSRFRGIRLQIELNGTVKLIVGKSVDNKALFKFLKTNEPWLTQKMQSIQSALTKHPPRVGLSNETFLFLGRSRHLFCESSKHEFVKVVSDKIIVGTSSFSANRALKLVRDYYKNQASEIIMEIVKIRSREMDLFPTKTIFRLNTSRWGSCNSKGVLSFNWKLISAPLKTIDYVVVHELAHLRHPNHSNEFWKLVAQFVPDHREHSRWLKANQFEMEFLEENSKLYVSGIEN